MTTTILYMNQGGGGDWGAVAYASYDILAIAESSTTKKGFSETYSSATHPVMTIFIRDGRRGRVITEAKDVDYLYESTRPLVMFQLVASKLHVVFVHLKSANVKKANAELEEACSAAAKHLAGTSFKGVLWIGDFNRATQDPATTFGRWFPKTEVLFASGGQAKWNLDRVYYSYLHERDRLDIETKKATKSSDHGHVGIKIVIP